MNARSKQSLLLARTPTRSKIRLPGTSSNTHTMVKNPRHKSNATLLSCKLLILFICIVSAMNFATNYLHRWMQQQQPPPQPGRSSRVPEAGIISAGRPDRDKDNSFHPDTRLQAPIYRIDKPSCSQTHEILEHSRHNLLDSLENLFRSPFIVVAAICLIRVEGLPASAEVGKPIKLKCSYELRGEKLQSLAWYKNGKEFYRYQPFERRQPVLTFNLAGINVDTIRSRNSTVHLTNTTLETSGRYKCEVTSTTFREAHQEVSIQVVEPESSGVTRTINSIILILPYATAVLLNRFVSLNQSWVQLLGG